MENGYSGVKGEAMKTTATIEEIVQTATTTQHNKYKLKVLIIGNKKECEKAWNDIRKYLTNK
ncbi:hypothetical protein KAT21_05470 [Candidatus Bathyarchaeota archaeon]|nr:hypothetical protein [Candidatus Bathyarchaeota archaeon]